MIRYGIGEGSAGVRTPMSTPKKIIYAIIGLFVPFTFSFICHLVANYRHPQSSELSKDSKVQKVSALSAVDTSSKQDDVSLGGASEASKQKDSQEQEVIVQPKANPLSEYMIYFKAIMSSIAIKRADPVTKVQTLKELNTKMICGEVSVKSVKEVCESDSDRCFLENQYKLFFESAEDLENQFMSGKFKCEDDAS